MRVNFTVNGRPQEADDVWEGESLLYVLRERMGLPGSKNACEQGECGSCTVRLDGVPVCSCLVAAGQVEGREVVTVEGLAEYAKQRAEHGGCASGACGTSLQDAPAVGGQGHDSQTGEGAELSPSSRRSSTRAPSSAASARPGLLVAADELLERNPTRPTRTSARRSPATCAAAPATRRSWTRSASRPPVRPGEAG